MRGVWSRWISAACVFLVVGALPALATHFRYGHVTYRDLGGNSVEFTVQAAFRWDAYQTGFGRCIDPATLFAVPCTGPAGNAGVGDIIIEAQGATAFAADLGDPGSEFSSPATDAFGFGGMLFLVTAIDPTDNTLSGLALDPTSLPAVDTTISYTYPAAGSFTAGIIGQGFVVACCRISAFVPPNEHINNPDDFYFVGADVVAGSGNSSPVSALPPIINCPINAVCLFQVPGVDPDGEAVSFRMSTSAEASLGPNFDQPGPPQAPNAASIDPNTGIYTWDTTGAALATNAANNTLYSTQVILEDATTHVALDFLIRLVDEDPTPPVIVPPPGSPPVCNTTQITSVGSTLTFDVQASDPDPADQVLLNSAGLPAGATMTPTLPLFGNPVSSTFSWTPGAPQVVVVQFTALSTGGGQALCPVTIEVSECPDDPAPLSQGYWHRQCLGLPGPDGIDPGRNGRGPDEPTEPDFAPNLTDCGFDRLEDLGFFGETTCGGLDADPANDPCEKAMKQTTALILNVCSGRLSDACGVTTSACAATSVGELLDELAGLIFGGECDKATSCADEVNQGTALPNAASAGGVLAQPKLEELSGKPRETSTPDGLRRSGQRPKGQAEPKR